MRRPKPPQPRRDSVSPLGKAAKSSLELRRPSPRRSLRQLNSGGWRRFRGLSRMGEPGIGDRTRRPSRLRSCLSSSHRALLRRLGGPPRLPGRVERHLAHLAHPVLGGAGDHQRLVDPCLQFAHQRHAAARHHPVLRTVSLLDPDARNLGAREAEKPQFGGIRSQRWNSAKEARRIPSRSIASLTAGSQSVLTSRKRSSP
jgi:hypothetical protein